MEDCVFCKIAKGEIPAEKVWENENFLAFLDANPSIRGHVLVIPKKHSRWVWDIDDKNYIGYMLSVKKVAGILKRAFNTECVQELIIGMGVPHTHIHLLPRTKDDGFSEFPKKPLSPNPSDEEMKKIAEKIKSNVHQSEDF